MSRLTFTVVDCETVGLDPLVSSMVSIGAVHYPSRKEYYTECRVWDNAKIEMRALSINGFTVAEVKDPSKPLESDAAQDFSKWSHSLGGAGMLAGITPQFDLGFVKAALARGGHQDLLPFGHRTIDLHALVVCYAAQSGLDVPLTGFGTDKIYAAIGLPPEPKPHNALTGAKCEMAALLMLLGRE